MSKLHPQTALAGLSRDYLGVSLTEVSKYELISLACAEGQEAGFKTAFKKRFGKTPPKPLELKLINDGYGFWSGQNQYMLLLEGENIEADREVETALQNVGYTTLQTDGWAHIALSGPRVLDVFERFIPLDMRAFKVGHATRTHAHHMAVMVLRLSEDDYRLLTPRSSCEAFIESLEHVIKCVMLSEKV